MANTQPSKAQKYCQMRYGAIALLSIVTVGSVVSTSPKALAQATNSLVCLCEVLPEADQFQCLLDQATRLNRAKNLARQRGERENGGVSLIETEPSMHGPAEESPYSLAIADHSMRYIFTFRVRPRATQNYTYESQVAINYTIENGEWTVETIYNQPISPTLLSYAESVLPIPEETSTCVP